LLLILFHDCLSTAWIHLKAVLDCDILHYTGTLITAKLHFFTLSFQPPVYPKFSYISTVLRNTILNTTHRY